MQVTCESSTALFSALAEPLRLRLACCLAAVPEGACVCELVDAVGEPQPNVSRHLKLMKHAGLLDERREGRWVYYRLRDVRQPLVARLRACLDAVCACDDVEACLKRLRARLRLRRAGRCVVGTRPAARA